MKRLGYVIMRTSLTKVECPYLLAAEINRKSWKNISSKGEQTCDTGSERQQFNLESCKNEVITRIYDIYPSSDSRDFLRGRKKDSSARMR